MELGIIRVPQGPNRRRSPLKQSVHFILCLTPACPPNYAFGVHPSIVLVHKVLNILHAPKWGIPDFNRFLDNLLGHLRGDARQQHRLTSPIQVVRSDLIYHMMARYPKQFVMGHWRFNLFTKDGLDHLHNSSRNLGFQQSNEVGYILRERLPPRVFF